MGSGVGKGEEEEEEEETVRELRLSPKRDFDPAPLSGGPRITYFCHRSDPNARRHSV